MSTHARPDHTNRNNASCYCQQQDQWSNSWRYQTATIVRTSKHESLSPRGSCCNRSHLARHPFLYVCIVLMLVQQICCDDHCTLRAVCDAVVAFFERCRSKNEQAWPSCPQTSNMYFNWTLYWQFLCFYGVIWFCVYFYVRKRLKFLHRSIQFDVASRTCCTIHGMIRFTLYLCVCTIMTVLHPNTVGKCEPPRCIEAVPEYPHIYCHFILCMYSVYVYVQAYSVHMNGIRPGLKHCYHRALLFWLHFINLSLSFHLILHGLDTLLVTIISGPGRCHISRSMGLPWLWPTSWPLMNKPSLFNLHCHFGEQYWNRIHLLLVLADHYLQCIIFYVCLCGSWQNVIHILFFYECFLFMLLQLCSECTTCVSMCCLHWQVSHCY